ncbi:MAG: hypothetical protein ABIJ45_04865 [Candidatus Zixiibacteriota bacterium]
MKKEITPIKNIPNELIFTGDYYATQSALIIGALGDKDITIHNHNINIETKQTAEFLKSIGIECIVKEDFIRVENGYGLTIKEDAELIFEGGVFPLSLIIGLLAGRNQTCTLKYDNLINPDIVDSIVNILNQNGIDIFNEANDRLIVFRSSIDLPVEIKLTTSVPYLKNCVILFSISSGISAIVQEFVTTTNHLERALKRFGLPFKIYEPKTIITDDPKDPRKKIRSREAEYQREISIPPSAKFDNLKIYLPADLISTVAIITLAILKKKELVLDKVAINQVSSKFINYLKSTSAEITISDRDEIEGETLATIEVTPRNIKAKKMAGEQATVLIDEIPFMAVIAALGDGTSIIRGVADYNDCGFAPFNEIANNLERLGVKAGVLEDGLVIEGKKEYAGADFGQFNDCRSALAFYIAALAGREPSTFDNFELIENHFPDIIKIV